MEIDEVFDANPISVEKLLREPGQCFYVPVYQRQYSWDSSHIRRLIGDIAHGVAQLTDSSDAITFLGTIITIHDTHYTTVDPQVQGQLPPKVMTVIDGQQRLTTLLLLVAALNNELTTHWSKLTEGDPDSAEKWLATKVQETHLILGKMLEDDRDFGDRRYYPRMTRAYVDRWSRDEPLARYDSPIAQFISAYGQHLRTNPKQSYSHQGDSAIRSRFLVMRKLLRGDIASGLESDDDVAFPNTAALLTTTHVKAGLLQNDFPAEALDRLLDNSEDTTQFREIFRTLIFARFLLQRVAVTIVVAKSEDYAFDMFEALNTTGEPLTAIETFKPRVIQAETHALYEESESRKWMSGVEEYLDRYETAPARQSATEDLLIPFALAETGYKLSKRLNDQRRYLMTTYGDSGVDLQGRRAYVRHLALASRVVDRGWKPVEGPPALPPAPFDSETKMCLAVLKAANHHIVLAPLIRFYDLFRSGVVSADELARAVRSFTAFFALWRGAHGGTASIDTIYRALMSAGDVDDGIRPFARRPKTEFGHEHEISVDVLQRYFRKRLASKSIGSRSSWVDRAAEVPVYSASTPLTRLLLLAASHDSVPDLAEPGHVKAGNAGVLRLLDLESWSEAGTLSVEHIAPRSRTDEWDPSFYSDEGTVHRLGNLVLVPIGENSGLSNLGWTAKRACYRVLSSTSPDESEEALAAAASAGIEIPPSIAANQTYRPVTAGVARYELEWSRSMIDERSKRLAGLAWDRLSHWLGYP